MKRITSKEFEFLIARKPSPDTRGTYYVIDDKRVRWGPTYTDAADKNSETLRQAREALLQSAAALHVIAQSLEGADEPASAPEPKSPPLVSMTDGHGAKLGRKAACEQSRADESDGEKLDPETALLQRVLTDAEQAEISAFSAIGVLTTAATMMVSQCYDLTKLGDDHADA